MLDCSGYDKKAAIKYTRDIDKHNGYMDFANFVLDIVLSGETPQANNPAVHAAKYVLDYFRKMGIEPGKKNYQEINLRLGGIKAAAEVFPLHSPASFDEIAKLSEAVLAEGLKPWDSGFMKKVREKKQL